MWNDTDPRYTKDYKSWSGMKGVPVQVSNEYGEEKQVMKPTFSENLTYFFRYQIIHMYFRYFMWNFSGKQNDTQGRADQKNGNWISGIPWFDENILGLGPQDNLPDSTRNPAHNEFYMLPFLLGLLGLFYHLNKNKKDTLIVALLFLMRGMAITVYLNQYPYQPRERDYAYAGSFYAFAIWIGLGVMALFDMLQKRMGAKFAAITVTVVSLLLVPTIMAKEGWNDHDRSGKYAARDFAAN